jgi:hypothetical protein
MTVTPTALYRAAAAAAAAAGVIFIGIQIGHPHSDVDTVTTTEWAVRNGLKVLMAGLALVGITGMYLRQIKQTGLLGLVGYVAFAIGYLAIMCVTFVSGFVFPSIAATDPGYVNDVLAAGTGGKAVSDIGLVQVGLTVSGAAFLGGGLLFGIALYRARVLARWAAALLAAASVFTVSLTVLPDSLFRFLAVPNAVALIGLGCSLWVATAPEPAAPHLTVPAELPVGAGTA